MRVEFLVNILLSCLICGSFCVTKTKLQIEFARTLRENDPCPEKGFYRDETNCKKFYRCADLPLGNGLIKYEFECPAGTVFGEQISTCNYEDQIDSLPTNCKSSEVSPQNPAVPGSLYHLVHPVPLVYFYPLHKQLFHQPIYHNPYRVLVHG